MITAHWTSRNATIVVPPRREDVVVNEHDNEVVISIPTDGSTYHLNPTAVLVWERCDGRSTTREIAQHLADAYDVSFDEALNDVEELVLWLAESTLLREPDET